MDHNSVLDQYRNTKIIRLVSLQKFLFCLIVTMLSISTIMAQNYELKDYSVTSDGVELAYPFLGGFTAPQLVPIDLNQDGLKDLVVYDRRGNVPRTFINNGSQFGQIYDYDPAYQKSLPAMSGFMKVGDFNQDGIGDIFTTSKESNGSIAVYRGMWDGKFIRYQMVEFDHFFWDVLTILANGSFTNLYLDPFDIPAILDMDDDGDLDILTFNSGGSYVAYYRNTVVEKGLGLDTLDYVLEDFCWGKFQEGSFDSTIYLSDNPDNCAEGFQNEQISTERHAGSTVEAFDYEGDGDYDLIIGDLLSNNLALVINEPVNGVAFAIDTILKYPPSTPTDIYVFASSFVFDVDNDGIEDLVAAPNEESFGTNIQNLWFYKNVGDNTNHDFQLQQTDFINGESLDFGTDSSPAFLDFNQDGLQDLVVGTSGELDDFGQIQNVALVLLENIGTIDNPSYQINDADWLDFSINTQFSNNPVPAIGDLDGDGDDDMLVGDSNGELYYYENMADPGNPYDFAQAVFPFMDIDVGQQVEPFIFDYNKDGLGDIFIGEKSTNVTVGVGLGNINYFQNIGEIGSPNFTNDTESLPNTATFGQISTTVGGGEAGSSAPILFDLNDRLFVMCGTERLGIQLFEGNYTNVLDSFPTIDPHLGDILEGEETSIDVADIDNDGYLELVVGNKRGGIAIYNTEIYENGEITHVEANLQVEEKIEVYPNPTLDQIYVKSTGQAFKYILVDPFGQILMLVYNPTNDVEFDLSTLPAGLYFLHAEFEHSKQTTRVVKL